MRRIIILIFLLSIHNRLYALQDNAFPITSDFEMHKIDDVSGSFSSVNFVNTYSTSPVVVCTYNLPSGGTEAVVRLNSISATGFEIKLQRPIDRTVSNATVQCLIASEGTHTLDNGYQFEAHKVNSNDTSGNSANGWNGTGEEVSGLIGSHGGNPAVLGQVMTYHDADFSVFWTYDCSNRANPPSSSNICVGKHIGSTSRDTEPRATEKIGYIVIESDKNNDGNADGNNWLLSGWSIVYYRVELGDDTIDGVANNGDKYSLSHDYKLGVATQSAMNGTDGGWAVFFGNDPFGGNDVDLAIEEDTLDGSNRSHTHEEVAYWVFDKDPGLNWMEIKKFTDIDGTWKAVSFKNTSYTNAVPVCTYNLAQKSDTEALVRIKDITSSGMKIRLQQPKNNSGVTSGDVYCIIMEEGSSNTFDGRKVEAHIVDSVKTNSREIGWSQSKMKDVGYTNSYNMPVVLGQVISYQDMNPDWSVFWCSRNSAGDPPNKNNLYVGKHIGKEKRRYRADETLGFIIGAPHEGEINHIYYKIARGADSVAGEGNSPPYSYAFSGGSHTEYTYGVATQNAEDGGDGGWAVLYGTDPISGQINLAIDEETVAGDTTRTHTTEEVAYWVFDPYPVISLGKTSCVIDDPVNGSVVDGHHPKRIPGATIRYAIEVNNTGFREAENVLTEDNVSSEFNLGTITNLKIDGSNGCNCLSPVSAGANGSGGSADGISPVKLDHGTVARGTSADPTSECGYFEVDIE